MKYAKNDDKVFSRAKEIHLNDKKLVQGSWTDRQAGRQAAPLYASFFSLVR